ncbi:LptA/OstA family protein [Asticcacaulis machinosus]|uniref:LptA/OstA family protein n=1 Tax=Asticcacaulis machinosus TaxID=2984211 RepID=A0ABT5HK23_9CAUL|nr:LptA/OstA family protein [Asticcacaulis machinosus]MDC7676481.1 LptA/OstA family protein [Asticcacaulis machinosus]
MASGHFLRLVAGLAAMAALGLSGGIAQAQLSQKGGPVAIGGDDLELLEGERVQLWTGRVEVLQDDTRLRADQVRMIHAPKPGGGAGFGEVDRIEATGNLYFVQGNQVIRGDKAVYTRADDTMIVTGDVIVKQGENVMTGNRLVYNVSAGRTTMDAAQSKGRVRAVIYPDNKPAQ